MAEIAASPEDTVVNPPCFDVIEFDVTDVVKNETANDGMLTLVVKSTDKCVSDYLSAYSKENADLRPYIEIT